MKTPPRQQQGPPQPQPGPRQPPPRQPPPPPCQPPPPPPPCQPPPPPACQSACATGADRIIPDSAAAAANIVRDRKDRMRSNSRPGFSQHPDHGGVMTMRQSPTDHSDHVGVGSRARIVFQPNDFADLARRRPSVDQSSASATKPPTALSTRPVNSRSRVRKAACQVGQPWPDVRGELRYQPLDTGPPAAFLRALRERLPERLDQSRDACLP